MHAMGGLLLATTNRDKLEEYRSILAGIPFRLLSPADLGLELDVEESGLTFAENAVLKAQAYAEASGLLALADDSGLEIDALGGAPGIYSARFLGRETPYEERFRVILERLREVPVERRTARFRCCIALARPHDGHRVVEGVIEGLIAAAPRGSYGFGYDPLFLVPELGKTLAELLPAEKHRISHRGRAARRARELLADCSYHLSSAPGDSA